MSQKRKKLFQILRGPQWSITKCYSGRMDMRIIFSCKWKLCKEKDSVSLSLSSAMQLPRVADHVVWELKKSQLRIGLQYFTCVEIKLKEEKEGKKEEGGGGASIFLFVAQHSQDSHNMWGESTYRKHWMLKWKNNKSLFLKFRQLSVFWILTLMHLLMNVPVILSLGQLPLHSFFFPLRATETNTNAPFFDKVWTVISYFAAEISSCSLCPLRSSHKVEVGGAWRTVTSQTPLHQSGRKQPSVHLDWDPNFNLEVPKEKMWLVVRFKSTTVTNPNTRSTAGGADAPAGRR